MRRYTAYLIALTAVLTIAACATMWVAPERFSIALPLLALYFGIITGLQHYAVVQSMYKSPRTFIKVFLGLTVGVLLIHLIVLCTFLFTHPTQAKTFTLAFCIGYVAFLVFETVALVRLINSEKKKTKDN